MACIKRDTYVVKNGKEKRTERLSDFVGEAKFKLFYPNRSVLRMKSIVSRSITRVRQ